ncbi:hypothetical protein CDIK_0759 [Cucumispora dikerogammari]|nr:hypothetical protein CDIK_0759 [Cucumispora dikerogammari]
MAVPLFHIFSTVFGEPLKTKKISLSTQPGNDLILNDILEVKDQVFMFFARDPSKSDNENTNQDKAEDKNTNNNDEIVKDTKEEYKETDNISLGQDIDNINMSGNINIVDNKNTSDNKNITGNINIGDINISTNVNKTSNSRKTLILRPLQTVYPLFYTSRKQSRYRTADTVIIFEPFNYIKIKTLGIVGKYKETTFINNTMCQLYETEDVKCPGEKNEHKIRLMVHIVPPILLLTEHKVDPNALDGFQPMKSQLLGIDEENNEYKIVISSNLYCNLIEEEDVIVGFVRHTNEL